MGNPPERRTSKRLAAAPDYENDDDFVFARKSKKAKTEESAEPPKKLGRGRPPKRGANKENSLETVTEKESGKTERPTHRKSAAESLQEEPQPKVPKKGSRKSTRQAVEDDQDTRQAGKKGVLRDNGARKGKSNSRTATSIFDSPEAPVRSAKITLPMSDTPIINRNKEMRKKGTGNRRSSLGSRGRRASSLIDNGQTALPHREVKPAEFYKHIEADGLTEPRRMKQLLTWCGERALSEKPRHGTANSSVIHGARAIQDQLLKDFASRSDFSDWFSRDESPKAAVVLQPNPRNIELDEKLAQLEESIKKYGTIQNGIMKPSANSRSRLQEEKKSWQAMRKPPPEQPSLFSDTETADQITLPDFDLLDEEDGRIRAYLGDESISFEAVHSRSEERLRNVRSSLEFEIDQLADNIHKLEQRVSVAGEEADKVLSLSARRLREREQRERTDAGTKDMPIMEVLRSLGNILPEGGG
ncbi:hypothetical protein ACO1O0_002021 [Amphichorda felina]